MPRTIYVISAYGGSYDDYWTRDMYAVSDLAAAEQAVAEETAKHRRLCDVGVLINEFIAQQPSLRPDNLERIPDYPKGPARPISATSAAYDTEVRRWHAESSTVRRWYAERDQIYARNAKVRLAFDKNMVALIMARAAVAGITPEEVNAVGVYTNDHVALLWVDYDDDVAYQHTRLELF